MLAGHFAEFYAERAFRQIEMWKNKEKPPVPKWQSSEDKNANGKRASNGSGAGAGGGKRGKVWQAPQRATKGDYDELWGSAFYKGQNGKGKQNVWVLSLTKGKDNYYVGVRNWFEGKGGEMCPGEKGVSLPAEVFQALVAGSGELNAKFKVRVLWRTCAA
jgi:hypothetical protein